MDVIHSVDALRLRLQHEPNNVFVPTMGNLHAGHIQLINIAKPRAACTVVSIFVNRLQFGPQEDFERYPRTLESDCAKLRDAGVDVVFVPDEREIYSEPQTFLVEPSDLQHILDDTVRAGEGPALSSRNDYLSAEERREAPHLYQLLCEAREAIAAGARDYQPIELDVMAALAHHGWKPDYIAVRRQSDLQPPAEGDRRLVVLAAARLGRARRLGHGGGDAQAPGRGGG